MAAETLCKNHICQGFLENPYLVPARWGANADKFIGEANATVTAVSCSENTEWVNSTDGSIWWEDCACNCGAATRVPLLGLVGIMVFYVVVVFLFVTGIKILRAGPTKEYENLKAAGKVTEDTEEIGGEAARAWMTKSEDEIRTDCGLDAAVYLLHCRQCAMFWLIQGCSIGLVLILAYGFAGDYDEKPHILTLSSANLMSTNAAKWIQVLAQYWFVGTTIFFTMWKQKGMDAYKLEAEEEGGRHTSLNTVWIQNITMGASEDALKSWFESNYEGQVLEAKMVWDVNALGHNIRARRRLIMKINALTAQVAGSPDDAGSAKTKLKIESLTQQVKRLEEWEPDLRGRTVRSAGHAFVTFVSEAATQTFRQDLPSKQSGTMTGDAASLGVSKWQAVMAPRTAEIYWENFGLESGEKLANQAKALGFTMVMFVIFVVAALGAFYILGFVYMWLLYNAFPTADHADSYESARDAVGPVVWYGVFGLFFAVLFLGLEEEMSPIVKFICKFESPFTKSIKQSSYLSKMYWFYVIFHVALSTVLLGVLAMWCNVKNIPVVPGGCEETHGEIDADGEKCRGGRLQLYVQRESVMSYYYSYLDYPYTYSRYYDYPSYYPYYSRYYDLPYYSRYSSYLDYPYSYSRYPYSSYYPYSRYSLDYPYYSRYYDYPSYYSRYSPYYSRYAPLPLLPETKSVTYETVKKETVYSPYTGSRTYTTVI